MTSSPSSFATTSSKRCPRSSRRRLQPSTSPLSHRRAALLLATAVRLTSPSGLNLTITDSSRSSSSSSVVAVQSVPLLISAACLPLAAARTSPAWDEATPLPAPLPAFPDLELPLVVSRRRPATTATALSLPLAPVPTRLKAMLVSAAVPSVVDQLARLLVALARRLATSKHLAMALAWNRPLEMGRTS